MVFHMETSSLQKVGIFLTETAGSDGKESSCNAGNPGLTPGLGRSPREGNGNPLQDPYLEHSVTEKPGGIRSLGSQRGLSN